MNEFNASEVLKEVRLRRLAKKRKLKNMPGRLNRHAFELLSLRDSGASLKDLQEFLRSNKHIVIDISTISRFLKKCNEVQEHTLNAMEGENESISLNQCAQ